MKLCNSVEISREYKIVPKRYKSNFNKLTLVSEEYKVFCEPVEFNDFKEYCDIELACEWLKEQISLEVMKMFSESNKVAWPS